jgi:hypothetical protein
MLGAGSLFCRAGRPCVGGAIRSEPLCHNLRPPHSLAFTRLHNLRHRVRFYRQCPSSPSHSPVTTSNSIPQNIPPYPHPSPLHSIPCPVLSPLIDPPDRIHTPSNMDLSALGSSLPPGLADAERDMGDKFRGMSGARIALITWLRAARCVATVALDDVAVASPSQPPR